MKVLQFFGGIVFLFTILSCSKDNDDQLPDDAVKLKFARQQSVSDDLLLEITNIVDTRCPIGVVCSEAGDVKIEVRVLAVGNIHTKTISFCEMPKANQNIDTIDGHRIEILRVMPMPYLNNPVDSISDYIVTIVAKKL